MECPKCKQTTTKNGFVKGKQRWLCKSCNYYFTNPTYQRGKPKELKDMAINLYLEGLGFRAIGRLLNVSNVSVLNWVRKLGKNLSKTKPELPKTAQCIELDEMCHYVSNKKNSGFGSQQIEKARKLLNGKLEVEVKELQKSYGIRLKI